MKSDQKYVPVLRWKGAEIGAVRDLDENTRNSIQPLFEFVPKDFSDDNLPIERTVVLKVRQLVENWGWNKTFFADFSLLDADKALKAAALFGLQADGLLSAVLCFSIETRCEDLRSFQEYGLFKKYGMCVRIDAFELQQPEIRIKLMNLVRETLLSPESIDIVIDYRIIDSEQKNIKPTVEALPMLRRWRSITIVAGAFPKDLSELEKNNQHLLPREDWLSWRKYALKGGLAGYGDYTIQHGLFEEREGTRVNFSASIRYTGPADWVIMRGEGVFNKGGPGFAQWPANAQLLCERPEFSGEKFSAGDKFIKEMSLQSLNTGGAKEWLTAGIIHHLAYIVDQLNHLNETPSRSAALNEAAPDWPAYIGQPVSHDESK